MEKRPEKTPAARIFACSTVKLLLLLVLFVPPFSLLEPFSLPVQPEYPDKPAVARAEKPLPKKLLKIYQILKSRRPDMNDAQAWRLSGVILSESSRHHLDPLLVTAIIRNESNFEHTAVSPVGARGLMQIMPDTGRYLAEALHREFGLHPAGFHPELLDDPLHNIRLGTYYLRGLKNRFRDMQLVLAAYNLGPGEIQNRIENDIEFSDRFANAVLETYRRYQEASAKF